MGKRTVLKIIYLLIGLIPFCLVSYLFGHRLLYGITRGNDFSHALNYTFWLNRFFPKVPFWFPLNGGGQSFVQSSQLGAFFIPIILNRLTTINLTQAFRLMAFLSVPLTALGIYLFAWYKLKNQTLALLAGFFYTLSQSTWTWLFDTGLYSQSVSLIFILPIVIFFDLFLCSEGKKRKIWFGITSLFLAVLSFTHLASGLTVFELLLLYSFFWSYFERKEKLSLKGIFQALVKPLSVIAVSILLIGFWFFPYLRYFSITGESGLTFPDLSAFPHFKIGGLLGILGPQQTFGTETAWYMFIATPVLILAAVGLIIGIFRKKRIAIVLAIISIFFMFQTSLPEYWPKMPMIIARFWRIVTIRAIIPTFLFLPILAAFGVGEVARIILLPLRKFATVSKILKLPLVIILVVLSLIFFRHVPPGMENYLGYGPANFFKITLRKGQIGMEEGELFAPWQLDKDPGFYFKETIEEIKNKLKLTPQDRIDLSPNWGGIIQVWSLFSDTPITTTYNILGLPNLPLWSYQQSAFYNSNTPATSKEVNQLAKYFGINYAVLYEGLDPIERFDSNWSEVLMGEEVLRVYKYQNPTKRTELTDKPLILVIGSLKRNAYETLFRLANLGIINYEDAILVFGKEKIDDYSLAELKQYRAVVAYGYTYKNATKAWELLAGYVKEGGNLFIETGWQYVDPDWQMSQTPEIIPVSSTTWKSYSDWNIEGFGPPSYNGAPWGVSEGIGLKPWAKAVVEINGQVLIAQGNLGKGKVVWSGMNLPAHAYFSKKDTEYQFINQLITFLTPLGGRVDTNVKITRTYPDKVEFKLLGPSSNQNLYFKENYFPDWKARVKVNGQWQSGEVLKVGAGHLMIRLSNGATEIVLEYKASKTVVLSIVVSVVSFLILVIYMVTNKQLFGFNLKKKIEGLGIKKWWENQDEV